jgi:hypothetical protein
MTKIEKNIMFLGYLSNILEATHKFIVGNC